MQRGLQNIGMGQGLETMINGITRRKEASMHLESIKELSESFGAEAAPMVVTVEGETRRLTGTAAAQYESWRRLLKEIYEAQMPRMPILCGYRNRQVKRSLVNAGPPSRN